MVDFTADVLQAGVIFCIGRTRRVGDAMLVAMELGDRYQQIFGRNRQ